MLILVFRSPIVPVVSLITVGITYIVSLSIITLLAEHVDFPFSSFTQVFLIVILFGVGTDYNILLYTRFKEELSRQENVWTATKDTIRSSGKTVVFSGIAVFIGFATLGLADFSLYQAMAAVAIGVAILILVLITLNPFFMGLLGKKMFWPSKRFEGHGDSRLWAFLSGKSALRPIVGIVIALIIILPFLFTYKGAVHYNDLLEVSNDYSSKQGIQVIQDKFPSGFSSPASVVIHADNALDSQEMLMYIDEMTESINQVDGVAEVMSPTRPTGSKIEELYITDQSNTVGSGIGEANSGTGEIFEGLSDAEQQLAASDTSGLDSVQQLIDGTIVASNGATALQDAILQISSGISAGADGAAEIENGLVSLSDNLTMVSSATSELYTGYTQIETGLSTFSESLSNMTATIESKLDYIGELQAALESFLAENPEVAADPSVREALEKASNGAENTKELTDGLNAASNQMEQSLVAFRNANDSLNQVNSSIDQIIAGADKLAAGSSELQSSFQEGAEGAVLVGENAGQLSAGLTEIQTAQQQLQDGLGSLQEQMQLLQEGLLASTEGLDEISNGLQDAEGFLGEMSKSKAAESFFVPEDVLQGENFQKALDTYMSDDRKTARFTVILDVDPFSTEAMDVVKEIQTTAESAAKGTPLDQSIIAVGGQSAVNADLREVAEGDFIRTVVIMLAGIGIFLIFITRSVTLPVFIIGLLTLAYYTSLSITEKISGAIFGVNQLSWNVPFFGFILLVAIGVDYSIFLLMNYRENKGDAVAKIVSAARHIGGVVMSAAIILGGTFAALYPSSVLTLMQVATVVIVGLALLSLLMLPVILPALISMMKKLSNWAKRGEE